MPAEGTTESTSAGDYIVARTEFADTEVPTQGISNLASVEDPILTSTELTSYEISTEIRSTSAEISRVSPDAEILNETQVKLTRSAPDSKSTSTLVTQSVATDMPNKTIIDSLNIGISTISSTEPTSTEVPTEMTDQASSGVSTVKSMQLETSDGEISKNGTDILISSRPTESTSVVEIRTEAVDRLASFGISTLSRAALTATMLNKTSAEVSTNTTADSTSSEIPTQTPLPTNAEVTALTDSELTRTEITTTKTTDRLASAEVSAVTRSTEFRSTGSLTFGVDLSNIRSTTQHTNIPTPNIAPLCCRCKCCNTSWTSSSRSGNCRTCSDPELQAAVDCASSDVVAVPPPGIEIERPNFQAPGRMEGSRYAERLAYTDAFQRASNLTELLASFPDEEKRDLGFGIDDLLLECSYDGTPCNMTS